MDLQEKIGMLFFAALVIFVAGCVGLFLYITSLERTTAGTTTQHYAAAEGAIDFTR
jgi:hypothetical protein